METFEGPEEAPGATVKVSEIVPEIVIADGRAVPSHLPGPEQPPLSEIITDPITVITGLENAFPIIYITDVNGVEKNKPQLPLLQKLTRHAQLWIEPGIRYADNIIDIIVAGAAEVILSTSTLSGFHELMDALELSPNIIFNVDFDIERNQVIGADSYIRGYSLEKLLHELLSMGIRRIILTIHPTMGFSESKTHHNMSYGGSRRPSIFELIPSLVIPQLQLQLQPQPQPQRRSRSSMSYRRMESQDHGWAESDSGLELFARGMVAWEHRDWLLENGWSGVITDIFRIDPPSLRKSHHGGG